MDAQQLWAKAKDLLVDQLRPQEMAVVESLVPAPESTESNLILVPRVQLDVIIQESVDAVVEGVAVGYRWP